MYKRPCFVSDGFLFREFQLPQSMYAYLYVYFGFWDIYPSGTGRRMSEHVKSDFPCNQHPIAREFRFRLCPCVFQLYSGVCCNPSPNIGSKSLPILPEYLVLSMSYIGYNMIPSRKRSTDMDRRQYRIF